jgi:hypothetical protein
MQSFMADVLSPAEKIMLRTEDWEPLRSNRVRAEAPPLNAWVDLERFRLAWSQVLEELDGHQRAGAQVGLGAWLAANLISAAFRAADSLARGEPISLLEFPIDRGVFTRLASEALDIDSRRVSPEMADWAQKLVASGIAGRVALNEWETQRKTLANRRAVREAMTSASTRLNEALEVIGRKDSDD